MIVIFEHEYLRQLYEDGKCKDKKHRYQPDIVNRYQKAVRFLITASSLEGSLVYSFSKLRGAFRRQGRTIFN